MAESGVEERIRKLGEINLNSRFSKSFRKEVDVCCGPETCLHNHVVAWTV
jgi:hypothetical protein